jgi:hypothetical protein
MTVLEEGVKAYIEAQVTAAGNGYPYEVPEDADFPAWSYQTINDEQMLAHDRATGFYQARMQLTFMAKETASQSDYAIIKGIAATARAALDGYKGTMGSAVYVKYCKTTLSDDWADIHKLPVQRFDVDINYKLT